MIVHPFQPFTFQQAQSFQYFAGKLFRFNILPGFPQIESPQVADCKYFNRFDPYFF
jgi:hypothetical protein